MDPVEPKEDYSSEEHMSHGEDSLLAAYRNYKMNSTTQHEDPLGKCFIFG